LKKPFRFKKNSFAPGGLPKKRGGEKAVTIQLRNGTGMISISAHPEDEKREEQHLNAQHAHTLLLLALHLLLFD
jgi:hypothetical protein